MRETTFKPGDRTFFTSDSLTPPYSAAFEDDGQTGYFYAIDLTRSDNMILGTVHIYNVANVSDRERLSSLSIVWSADGMKCALLINDYHTPRSISLQGGAAAEPTFQTRRTLQRPAGRTPITIGRTKRLRG